MRKGHEADIQTKSSNSAPDSLPSDMNSQSEGETLNHAKYDVPYIWNLFRMIIGS